MKPTKNIRKLVKGLEKGEISVTEIPWEYEKDPALVAYQRKKGLRRAGRRGYDVLKGEFFVEDLLFYQDQGDRHSAPVTTWFKEFEQYKQFLSGDVYTDADYGLLPGVEGLLDMSKVKPFFKARITDYTLEPGSLEQKTYQEGDMLRSQCLKWDKRFCKCRSYRMLCRTAARYLESDLAAKVGVDVFLVQYLFDDIFDKRRVLFVVRWLCSEAGRGFEGVLPALCRLYGTGDIRSVLDSLQQMMECPVKEWAKGLWGDIRALALSADACREHLLVLSVIRDTMLSEDDLSLEEMEKRIGDLDTCIQKLADGELDCQRDAFFDPAINLYCERVKICSRDGSQVSEARRLFGRFDEFTAHWGTDLSGCDISGDLKLHADLSGFTMDGGTKVPAYLRPDISCQVRKGYRDNSFYVAQRWYSDGEVIKEYYHTFTYFMDFAAFLEYDFTGADLLFCEGLQNINPRMLKLQGARMTSRVCDHFGIPWKPYPMSPGWSRTFEETRNNESKPGLVLHMPDKPTSQETASQSVYYISDLHLDHRIKATGCRSREDVTYVVHSAARELAGQVGDQSLLCIAGDTASNFQVFSLFAAYLKQCLPSGVSVVFTLGNHELWGFPNMPVDRVVFLYRKLLSKYGMYLLHNDILYRTDKDGMGHISWMDLLKSGLDDIKSQVSGTRYVLFGGIGFSGCNESFHADNGIYQESMSRDIEIQESRKIDLIYNRVARVLDGKNVIVVTHMPKEDWHIGSDYPHTFIHGHTHRSFRSTDGDHKVFADAQAGYGWQVLDVHSFGLDDSYDCFEDYEDGIYKVTKKQYGDFYSGKNLSMTFPAQDGTFYMLKKHGYYCFLHQMPNGSLGILNGGSRKHLKGTDVDAYYNAMGRMVDRAGAAFERFSNLQSEVSKAVKSIGGSGVIHGYMVEVDDRGSIRVDPKELSLSGYWADSLLDRAWYPSIMGFLKSRYPWMYAKYRELYQDGGVLIEHEMDDGPDVPPALTAGAMPKLERTQRLDDKILNEWDETVEV